MGPLDQAKVVCILRRMNRARRVAALIAACTAALGVWAVASAQFGPPSTFIGSVTDASGPVPAGLAVEAYIGDTLCGTKGTTAYVGDGDARVTVYDVDVNSESQTPGCGAPNKVVRIKVGDRFAEQTGKWNAGPVQVDLTFGNATPAVIPTFTPAPTRTPDPRGTAAPLTQQTAVSASGGTIPAGSPGAGSPVPTLKGGVTSATPGAPGTGSNDDGGFPIWGVAILVLGGIAAIGGGVGYAMSRGSRRIEDDDDFGPPDDEL
jgi:hypothetical protein